jgi:hypothetical protein
MGGADRTRRRRVLILWGLASFVACTFLPLWEVWYFSDFEATVQHTTLWQMLAIVRQPDPPEGVWPFVRIDWWSGLFSSAVLVAVASGVGWWTTRRPSPRAGTDVKREDAVREPSVTAGLTKYPGA